MEPLFSEAQCDSLKMLHDDPSAGALSDTILPFLSDTAELCSQLAASLASGDVGAAMHQSHTLKGSASTFALPRLGQRGGAIENALRDGNLEEARRLAEGLGELMSESRHEWEKRLAG